jgi:hypothetical protein
MKNFLLLLGLFTLLSGSLCSQKQWSLKKDKEGIRVYTGNLENSKFKTVKVECIIKSSLTQLATLLLNAESQPKWVYSTKSAYIARKISPSEIYYYAEMNTPWPICSRDMVIDLAITQDPGTKIMTVHADNIEKIIPGKTGKIRVPITEATWTVTPIQDNKIKINYSVRIDPGGEVPAWMVNMFIVKAPFESFKKLTSILQGSLSKEPKLNFLKD